MLEVSSFQLETTWRLNAEVALILNLSADHMDRYGSLEEYAGAKRRIFRGCRRIVLNRDDPFSRPPHPSAAPVISYGLDAPAPGQAGLLRVGGENWLALGDEPLVPAGKLKPPENTMFPTPSPRWRWRWRWCGEGSHWRGPESLSRFAAPLPMAGENRRG